MMVVWILMSCMVAGRVNNWVNLGMCCRRIGLIYKNVHSSWTCRRVTWWVCTCRCRWVIWRRCQGWRWRLNFRNNNMVMVMLRVILTEIRYVFSRFLQLRVWIIAIMMLIILLSRVIIMLLIMCNNSNDHSS